MQWGVSQEGGLNIFAAWCNKHYWRQKVNFSKLLHRFASAVRMLCPHRKVTHQTPGFSYFSTWRSQPRPFLGRNAVANEMARNSLQGSNDLQSPNMVTLWALSKMEIRRKTHIRLIRIHWHGSWVRLQNWLYSFAFTRSFFDLLGSSYFLNIFHLLLCPFLTLSFSSWLICTSPYSPTATSVSIHFEEIHILDWFWWDIFWTHWDP